MLVPRMRLCKAVVVKNEIVIFFLANYTFEKTLKSNHKKPNLVHIKEHQFKIRQRVTCDAG